MESHFAQVILSIGAGIDIIVWALCDSIEYWPDPQRGITEAYRVLKKGGKACLIGPVHPTFWLSRFFADVWMLFPTEEEYIDWFTKAGFTDVKLKRIGPKWYRGVRRHGLIMGCSVTGVKAESGESPLKVLNSLTQFLIKVEK
jgi:MPBQ/MSBQ methyltransferase